MTEKALDRLTAHRAPFEGCSATDIRGGRYTAPGHTYLPLGLPYPAIYRPSSEGTDGGSGPAARESSCCAKFSRFNAYGRGSETAGPGPS